MKNLAYNLGVIFLFLLIIPSCSGQGREHKTNAIIDSLGIIENQKYWYFDIRLQPLKYQTTKEDSIKLVEIENLLTDTEIRKRVINAFDEVLTDNEINDLYNFVTSSVYSKFFKFSTFNNSVSSQFKDINDELEKIDKQIERPDAISKFEPIFIEREDGFYVTINYERNIDNKNIILEEEPILTKNDILECEKDGNYAISITFNEYGAKKFYLATNNNIGKPIAIVIDKYIISMPTVNSAISDGKVIITGNFTEKEIEDMIKKLSNK